MQSVGGKNFRHDVANQISRMSRLVRLYRGMFKNNCFVANIVFDLQTQLKE